MSCYQVGIFQVNILVAYLYQAGMNAIKDGYTRYTPNAGTLELRKAICGCMNGRLSSQSYLLTEKTE